MSIAALFNPILAGWLAIAIIVFIALHIIDAPYGRHARSGWGPELSPKAGWILMEIPAVLVMPIFYLLGPNHGIVETVFLVIWEIHYIHRTFIFPFRIHGAGKPMPLAIAGSGFFFNLVNGSFQGIGIFYLRPAVAAGWLSDPRFIIGAAIFSTGMLINLHSDQVLFNLRAPGETGYKIPRGGFYRWLSSPNYFGELVEWIGWALLTWSTAGLAFAIWTFANLGPRARSNHRWYLEKFPDYPKSRKAMIPFIY